MIGSNFDDFLKEEGITFSKEEILKNAIVMAIYNREFDENGIIRYDNFLKEVKNDEELLKKYLR